MKPIHPILLQVSELYRIDKLREENKLLVYSDNITEKGSARILKSAEAKFEKRIENEVTRRKLFKVLVECLINVNIENVNSKGLNVSLLTVGLEGKGFFVLSGNTMKRTEVVFLQNKIEEINSMNDEQLKLRFKEILTNTECAKVKESGLYLVDIARKASNKLRYAFFPVDDKCIFFVLKIKMRED